MKYHSIIIAFLLCVGCHATRRPVVGMPQASMTQYYREPTTGTYYYEPCNPTTFQERDGGLILGGLGTTIAGVPALIGSNWVGDSQRRRDAVKPLTAAEIFGLLSIAGGGILMYDDDSPHPVCESVEQPVANSGL